MSSAGRCRFRPEDKRDLLEMAEHSELLAKSYGFNERLKDFITNRPQWV
jgi:hypothetical protein